MNQQQKLAKVESELSDCTEAQLFINSVWLLKQVKDLRETLIDIGFAKNEGRESSVYALRELARKAVGGLDI